MDSSGRPVTKGTDKDGNPVFQMRYVGPQDAHEGSTLRIVWAIPKLYITETTGPTPVAKDIYITHGTKRPSRARGVLDEVEVEEGADPKEILAVQHENIKASAAEEALPESGASDTAGYAASSSAAPASPVRNADDSSDAGRSTKRRGDAMSGTTKKARKVVVEEDF